MSAQSLDNWVKAAAAGRLRDFRGKDLTAEQMDAQVDRHVRGWEKTSDHALTWIRLADEAPPPKPRRARRKNKDAE